MLDAIHPWGGRVRAFRSQWIKTRVADEPWQLAGYWRLRHAIFTGEQRLFRDSDRDEHDERALPIVALSSTAGMPDAVVGVVRVYAAGHDEWFGGAARGVPDVSAPRRRRRDADPNGGRHGARRRLPALPGDGTARQCPLLSAPSLRNRRTDTRLWRHPYAHAGTPFGLYTPRPPSHSGHERLEHDARSIDSQIATCRGARGQA